MAGPKAILFDLDDTLNHRAGSIRVMANAFLQRFGGELGEVGRDELIALIVKFDGFGYRERGPFWEDLVGALPWRKRVGVGPVGEFWNEHFPKCCQPAADLRRVLDTLKARGLKLGIVTNGRTHSQNLKIDTLGIRHDFAAIVVSETVGVKKPDPAIFRIALERMGTGAEETWFVGDHPINDAAAAAKCGMTAVFLRNCHAWPDGLPRPAYTVRALGEVVGLVEGQRNAKRET